MPSTFTLSDLSLSPFTALESNSTRLPCPSCRKSHLWFCPDCILPLIPNTPSLSLPTNVHIVRHAGELPSKSSVLPLRLVLSEEYLKFYRYHSSFSSALPVTDATHSVVVFPSADAVSVDSIDWNDVTDVIFIDSTWFQATEVNQQLDPHIPRVSLNSGYTTFFWRPQHKGPDCLATVEAVYLLIRDAFLSQTDGVVATKYDDILWFYVFVRNLIMEKSRSRRVANK
jgi:DTW domain-containing protein YfiP